MTAGEPRTPAVSAPTGRAAYYEPARSYVSVWFFVGLLGALFLIDVAYGTAVVHLPGWIVAFLLVIGVDVLVVHSARVTRSLSLTETELAVGDETIERERIVGVLDGQDPELPVLGWPTGMPRGAKGITLRLVDDVEVVVPTRRPDRLKGALGVGPAAARAAAEVRPAEEADLALLPEIDERAGTLFRVAGLDLPDEPWDSGLEPLEILVVGEPAVAFARLTEVDGVAHLDELSVIPGAMRQGIGGRLVEASCAWAREQGYPAITLTTFADVAWNAPFYRRRGFVELEELTPGLQQVRQHEIEGDIDRGGRRIAMRRELT